MNAIEKRSRELYEAARGFYNATIGDPEVTIRCKSGEARDVVTAAANRCFLALLDQRTSLVAADNLQVVAAPAHGAHEVQPEAVDVGLDLAEPGERLLAADALEHGAGVRPEGDGQATANHVAHNLKMVAAHPDHSEHSLDMVNPMSVPDGFVRVPAELVKAVEDLSLIYEAGGDIDSKLSEIEAMLGALPEVKP